MISKISIESLSECVQICERLSRAIAISRGSDARDDAEPNHYKDSNANPARGHVHHICANRQANNQNDVSEQIQAERHFQHHLICEKHFHNQSALEMGVCVEVLPV